MPPFQPCACSLCMELGFARKGGKRRHLCWCARLQAQGGFNYKTYEAYTVGFLEAEMLVATCPCVTGKGHSCL
eukprot:scaffold183593_cov20-Tisochrysis_lutea.AAC.1